MKYKVGDTVEIISKKTFDKLSIDGDCYDTKLKRLKAGVRFASHMAIYCGQKAIIVKAYTCQPYHTSNKTQNCYRINIDANTWVWSDFMFIDIKKIRKQKLKKIKNYENNINTD